MTNHLHYPLKPPLCSNRAIRLFIKYGFNYNKAEGSAVHSILSAAAAAVSPSSAAVRPQPRAQAAAAAFSCASTTALAQRQTLHW